MKKYLLALGATLAITGCKGDNETFHCGPPPSPASDEAIDTHCDAIEDTTEDTSSDAIDVLDNDTDDAQDTQDDVEDTVDDTRDTQDDIEDTIDDTRDTEDDIDDTIDDTQDTQNDVEDTVDDTRDTEDDIDDTTDNTQDTQDDVEDIQDVDDTRDTQNDVEDTVDDTRDTEDDIEDTADDTRDTQDDVEDIQDVDDTRDTQNDVEDTVDDTRDTEDDIDDTIDDTQDTTDTITQEECTLVPFRMHQTANRVADVLGQNFNLYMPAQTGVIDFSRYGISQRYVDRAIQHFPQSGHNTVVVSGVRLDSNTPRSAIGTFQQDTATRQNYGPLHTVVDSTLPFTNPNAEVLAYKIVDGVPGTPEYRTYDLAFNEDTNSHELVSCRVRINEPAFASDNVCLSTCFDLTEPVRIGFTNLLTSPYSRVAE